MAVTSYGPHTGKIQASIRDPEQGPISSPRALTPYPKAASQARWQGADGPD